MKRLLFSTTFLLFSLLTFAQFTGTVSDSQGVKYTANYDESTCYVSGHDAYSATITIPEVFGGRRVTSIGYYAFSRCSGLTSVMIPSSVTSIGSYAFWGCNGLTSLTIPSSVTSIAGGAFWGCSGLTSVTIPSSVTSIGGGAFGECSGLTSIVVEEGNTIYDSRDNCNAIIRTADNTLIAGCKNTVIPSSVASIGENAFRDCSGLTSLTIPSSVTLIGDDAFFGCSSLTSLTIPSSVTSIGNEAFEFCSGLTSLTIPSSVTSIGDGAFSSCHGLTSVTIPSSVTSIGNYAFSGCSGLTSVVVGWESPLVIDGSVFGYLNYNNATLYVPNGTKAAYEAAEVWKDFGTIVEMWDVTDGALSDLQGLQYTANADLSTCYVSGHDDTYSSDLIIPISFRGRQVTTIAAGAFSGCNDLTSLAVKIETPLIIDSRAFEDSNYRSMTLRVPLGSKTAYDAADVWKDFGEIIEWFDKTYGEVADAQGVKYTANDDESTCYVSGHENTYSATITIPEIFGGRRVTSIGNEAFKFFSGLTSVTIPSSVTSIGDDAFYGCSGLTSLTIPSGVTSIGNSAFEGCSGLTSVTIPSSVTSIGGSAFFCCSGLTSVTIPSSVTSIGNHAFYGCI